MICEEEKERFLQTYTEKLAGSRFVVLSGRSPKGLPTDIYAQLIELAERQKLRTVLDLSLIHICSMKLSDINDELGTDLQSEDYDSIGGLIIEHLDRVPEDGAQTVSYTHLAKGSFYIGEKSGEVVPGNTGTTQSANNTESKPRHVCSFEWVITLDPTTGADGLEEYKCTGCGAVSYTHLDVYKRQGHELYLYRSVQ